MSKVSNDRPVMNWGVKVINVISLTPKFIAGLLVAALLWLATFVWSNISFPATQKQINNIQSSQKDLLRKDSMQTAQRQLQLDVINNKITATDVKVNAIQEEQKFQRDLLVKILFETRSLKSSHGGIYSIN